MADAKPKLELLPSLSDRQQASIHATLAEALGAHEEFSIVVVVAAVKNDDGSTGIRVLGSTASHFERLGLLEEGKDAILID